MTVDTNIVIAYLAGEKIVVRALSEWKEAGLPLLLPSVVETEVLSFSGLPYAEQARTEQFLESEFLFIPLDRSLARVAAHIRRTRRIKTPDSIVAATAIASGTSLVTRNVRDFRNVPGLTVLNI